MRTSKRLMFVYFVVFIINSQTNVVRGVCPARESCDGEYTSFCDEQVTCQPKKHLECRDNKCFCDKGYSVTRMMTCMLDFGSPCWVTGTGRKCNPDTGLECQLQICRCQDNERYNGTFNFVTGACEIKQFPGDAISSNASIQQDISKSDNKSETEETRRPGRPIFPIVNITAPILQSVNLVVNPVRNFFNEVASIPTRSDISGRSRNAFNMVTQAALDLITIPIRVASNVSSSFASTFRLPRTRDRE